MIAQERANQALTRVGGRADPSGKIKARSEKQLGLNGAAMDGLNYKVSLPPLTECPAHIVEQFAAHREGFSTYLRMQLGILSMAQIPEGAILAPRDFLSRFINVSPATTFVAGWETGKLSPHDIGALRYARDHLGVTRARGHHQFFVGDTQGDVVRTVAAKIRAGNFTNLSNKGFRGGDLNEAITCQGINPEDLTVHQSFLLAAAAVTIRGAEEVSGYLQQEPITPFIHYVDEGRDVLHALDASSALDNFMSLLNREEIVSAQDATRNNARIVLAKAEKNRVTCLCFGCCDSRALTVHALGRKGNSHIDTVANFIPEYDPAKPDPVFKEIARMAKKGIRDFYFLGHTAHNRTDKCGGVLAAMALSLGGPDARKIQSENPELVTWLRGARNPVNEVLAFAREKGLISEDSVSGKENVDDIVYALATEYISQQSMRNVQAFLRDQKKITDARVGFGLLQTDTRLIEIGVQPVAAEKGETPLSRQDRVRMDLERLLASLRNPAYLGDISTPCVSEPCADLATHPGRAPDTDPTITWMASCAKAFQRRQELRATIG